MSTKTAPAPAVDKQRRVRLQWSKGCVSISVLQLAFLNELTAGPSSWFSDHVEARALSRRGLAKSSYGWRTGHFVITEKGREVLRRASAEELRAASAAADCYDVEANAAGELQHPPNNQK